MGAHPRSSSGLVLVNRKLAGAPGGLVSTGTTLAVDRQVNGRGSSGEDTDHQLAVACEIRGRHQYGRVGPQLEASVSGIRHSILVDAGQDADVPVAGGEP